VYIQTKALESVFLLFQFSSFWNYAGHSFHFHTQEQMMLLKGNGKAIPVTGRGGA
jgi:hypothetical protein